MRVFRKNVENKMFVGGSSFVISIAIASLFHNPWLYSLVLLFGTYQLFIAFKNLNKLMQNNRYWHV